MIYKKVLKEILREYEKKRDRAIYEQRIRIKKVYEKFKNEPSVGFIVGESFADWHTFTNHILPDLPSQDLEEKYQQKREKAKSLIVEISEKGKENDG